MIIFGSQVCRDRSQRCDFRWLVLIGIFGYLAFSLPLSAVDCGECDAGCQLEADAFNLMEAYAEDKAGFAARSNRCAETDDLWTEIYENIREMDQPPPETEVKRRREVSRFELAMINHELRIGGCLQYCGLAIYREDCVAGPGGMSCNCKDAAYPYCRSQANQSAIDTIAPTFAGAGTAGPSAPAADDTQRDEETEGPEPEQAEEAKYMIEVAVSAEGFAPDTVFAPCNFDPSSVNVSGQVTDETGLPVGNARVRLVGLGASMATDARGHYSLTALTAGDAPFVAIRNFRIVRLMRNLRATVTPTSTVWANGRKVEAVLTVSADGAPLAGKQITLADWRGFSRGGNPVDYVVAGRGNHATLRLDDAGKVRFQFWAPVVPRGRGAALQSPDEKFPVDGHFRVMVQGQEAETECDYPVASPFPKIGQIRVPGNVDAGLWQVRPSSIVIEDPDSSRFTVTVRGLGDFRTTQPGAATKKGLLTHELNGSQFDFLYRPPEAAFDPAALPDVLDQFMNTSKNIYIGVATNVVGGMLVDTVQIRYADGAMEKGLSMIGLKLDAGKLLDAGGNMANIVNLGSGTYLDATAISEDPANPQSKVVAGGNFLIGVVDTSMGFAGTLGTTQQKLAWEAAKAYWEYIKLMNSLTNQYEEIGNAYQGTRFYPIEVTVEDEGGHRTVASRACSVREWKGGSQ
jgi:hypothetical protein